MLLSDYSFHTGLCVTQNTEEVITSQDIYQEILGLIHTGEGLLPRAMGLTYKFFDHEESANLVVSGANGDVLMSVFVPYRYCVAEAIEPLDTILLNGHETHSHLATNHLPEEIQTPCLITMLQPGSIFVGRDLIVMIGSIPVSFASVWYADKFGL